MKKFLLIAIPIVLILVGIFYWFFMRQATEPTNPTGSNQGTTFDPFGRGGSPNINNPSGGQGSATKPTQSSSSITSTPVVTSSDSKLPRLRQLSATPIGGFVASTTASSTIARFIDRGVGHVMQANSIDEEISKLSNTTIPKVYESYWNRAATAAIIRYIKDESGTITNFYGELKKIVRNASSTDETLPFEIKGKFISSNIKEIAIAPKGDRVFTYDVVDGNGTGYLSGFDESKKTKVFDSPLTQVRIQWPEENTLALATKASAYSSGFLYFIDVKKPALRRIMGDILGLTTNVSADAKRVLFSVGGASTKSYLLNLKDNSSQELVFKTLVEKCVWSKLHVTEAYCAVPTEIPVGVYPDDWYKGNVLFNDQIWHLDATTGEVSLVANLLGLSHSTIDAINLSLDPKEHFLYFMNKRDLTFWSLDLTQN